MSSLPFLPLRLGLQPVLLAFEPSEPAFLIAFDELVEEEGGLGALSEGVGGALTGEPAAWHLLHPPEPK